MADPNKVVGYVVYYVENGCGSGAFVRKGHSQTLWNTIAAMKRSWPGGTVWVKSVENIPMWVELG